ncbi:Mobile element protein [Brevinematales bacterium NS]|nr:Mobile element protein [Brevinematales bacterium NS]
MLHTPTLFVGIDVAKKDFFVCVLDDQRQVLHSSALPMEREGFDKLLTLLSIYPKESLVVGLESTGGYHHHLFRFLTSQSFRTFVLNPLQTRTFSRLSLRKTKTDSIDAHHIALFLLSQYHSLEKPFRHPCPELRSLTRYREKVVTLIAMVKNLLEDAIFDCFPEILEYTTGYPKSLLSLLLAFPSATAIQKASESSLEAFFPPNKRGRKSRLSITKIKELASSSIASPDSAEENVLQNIISQLFFLQEHLEKLDAHIQSLALQAFPTEIQILTSVPGIGLVGAATFLAEIGSISRFENYKKLIAYAGLDPAIYQSGQSSTTGHISRRGNRHLRRILFLLARSVRRFVPAFGEYFNLKFAQSRVAKKANLCVAHKLLRLLYAMLSHQTTFDPFRLTSFPQEVNL